MARLVGGSTAQRIDTDYLYVENNSIHWSDTIIQVSNISMITTSNVGIRPFPLLSVLIIAIGAVIIKWSVAAGTLIASIGIIWIVVWNQKVEGDKEMRLLNISLNSGINYTIVFHSKKFLAEVFNKLNELISNQGLVNSLTINIKDSTFHDNASIVGTFIDNTTMNVYINDIENARTATTDEKILEALNQLLAAVKKNDKPSVAKVITDFATQFSSGLFASIASSALLEFIRGFLK